MKTKRQSERNRDRLGDRRIKVETDGGQDRRTDISYRKGREREMQMKEDRRGDS